MKRDYGSLDKQDPVCLRMEQAVLSSLGKHIVLQLMCKDDQTFQKV